MKRVLLVAMLGMFGCDDDGDDGSSSSSTGTMGTSSGGHASSTSGQGTTTGIAPTTTDAAGSSSSGGEDDSSSGSTSGLDETGGSSSGGAAVVGFAEIQVDLENMGGAQGEYPSCIDGAPCHNNPERNVVLVADPTPEQLMQNYQNIIDAPVPWVTPMDETAQMLLEVPIPEDVRARWLTWIEAGAPFE